MPLDRNILLDKVKNLRTKVDRADFSDAFVAALNVGNALMQQRIFNANKDIQGNSFGVYIGEKKFISERSLKRLLSAATRTNKVRIKRASAFKLTPHQRKRANLGRQVFKKDLELMGELRRSIEIQIINERSAALQFNNDKAAKVARGQENQITNIRNGEKGYTTGDGIKIFAFNDSERLEVNSEAVKLIKEIMK